MKKICSISVALSFAVVTGFMPMRASATVPPLLHFGGWVDYTVPCTCSVATWGWMGPLYLAPAPVTGPLVYVPYSTFPMADYLITVPSVPHEGAYIPGVQACWMYGVVTCFPLPSIGMMGYVGTGLPGGK